MIGSKSKSVASLLLLLAVAAGSLVWLAGRIVPRPAPIASPRRPSPLEASPDPIPVAIAPEPRAAPPPPPPSASLPYFSPNFSPYPRNNVASMAKFLVRGEAQRGKAWAKAVAEKTELEDLMNVFLPRKPGREDSGLGVGPASAPSRPDGIERMLHILEKPATVEPAHLLEMAYRVQAVAEILAEYPLPKGSKQRAKDWREFSQAYQTAAAGSSRRCVPTSRSRSRKPRVP